MGNRLKTIQKEGDAFVKGKTTLTNEISHRDLNRYDWFV